MRAHLVTTLATLLAIAPSPLQALQADGTNGATDITAEEVEAVRAAIGDQIDLQIKVAALSQGNVAVGVLHRDRLENSGEVARGLVHREVDEVYYVLSGGGMLMTGGEVTTGRDLPADGRAVAELVGPSHLGSAQGGHVREISEGDLVIIPAGLFHAWTEIPDHVTYLSIRPDPEGVLPVGYVNPLIENR